MPHLLTPGPVPIPPFVSQALAKPVIHHRTEAFRQLYAGLLSDLRYLFQARGKVALALGSGTYGVEMAMYSLFQPGQQVLVVDMGKFSGRWGQYARVLGLEVAVLTKPWGQHASVQDILDRLRQHPDTGGLVLTHSETSTGAMIDLEEIAFAVRQVYPEMLILVDAITSVGAMPFYFDDWDLDFAVVASQKALLNPAGTIAFAASERAMARMRPMDKDDYQHLGNYLQLAQTGEFPFTAPVQLFYGLAAALAYMRAETLPVLWQRTHQSANHFRQGLQTIGGKLLAEDLPSTALTAFYVEGMMAKPIRSELEKAGFFLAGGQGAWKDRLLRISHMGMADKTVMEEVGQALKTCVSALKQP